MTKRALVCALVLSGLASDLIAQAPATLAFDAVSVKRNTTSQLPSTNVTERPDGGARMINVFVGTLISFAYPPATPATMESLPSWAMSERYDVVATSPLQTASPEQRAAMFRAMLADRFKLSAHFEPRETATYDLVFARDDRKLGPNLVPSTQDCERLKAERAGAPPVPRDLNAPPPPCTMRAVLEGGRIRVGQGDIVEGEGTMQDLARTLRSAVPRVVIDKTGLTGYYRVRLIGRFDRRMEIPDDPIPSVLTTMPEQLGLKLVASRSQTQVLVIDHVERPTEN